MKQNAEMVTSHFSLTADGQPFNPSILLPRPQFEVREAKCTIEMASLTSEMIIHHLNLTVQWVQLSAVDKLINGCK